MKQLIIIFMFLVGICVASSCSSDISEENKYGSIAGSVSDATTGEPVPTVKVKLTPGGNSTVTGTDGSFTFPSLEPAEYTLDFSKEGYQTNSAKVNVRVGTPTSAHLLIERIPSIVTADRETLDFGDNQSLNTLSFNIVNSGYQKLDWKIEEHCEWITEINPSSGTLDYGKTAGIVVVIDRDKLNPGENKAVIVIRSSNGSSQMNVVAVGADKSLPKLNTLAVTDIKSSSALLNGEIIDNGNPEYTERGFVYSKTSMPTIENTIKKISCTLDGELKYSYELNGLDLKETYFVRAYAVNKDGISYSSNEMKFTTVEILPVVKTIEIYNPEIGEGTATFRGEIVSIGDPAYTERGFVYSEMPNPTIYDEHVVANGSGVASTFSKSVSDLPKNGYYMRAYATSIGGTSYGEELHVEPLWIEIPSAGIAVQKEDLGKAYWSTAETMCKNSNLGGYTDWRLPTKDELMVLYNNRDKIGGFYCKYYNASYMDSSRLSYYWSCTEHLTNSQDTYYYYIDFYNGDIGHARSSNYKCSVRAVRTLTK